MSLNYDALERQSSKLFELIRKEQDILQKSKIPFSTYKSEESLRQLNNTIVKAGKIPPDRLMDSAGPFAVAALTNPVFLVAAALIGGGAFAFDAYQRNKAEQEARKALDEAYKCLVVNLEKMDELLNQKMEDLNQVFWANFRRRKKLKDDISEIAAQISEIQSFKNSVTA